jgi:hypothetical protein
LEDIKLQSPNDSLSNTSSSTTSSAKRSKTEKQLEEVDPDQFQEAKIVYEMLNSMDKQVRPGSKWYIISNSWIEKWQKYVYFDYLSQDNESSKE